MSAPAEAAAPAVTGSQHGKQVMYIVSGSIFSVLSHSVNAQTYCLAQNKAVCYDLT